MKNPWRKYWLSIILFFLSLVLSIGFSTPTLAHWEDLSVAEIIIGKKQTVITLTLPTSLVAFGDDNRDGQLSQGETTIHKTEIEQFLGNKVSLTDNDGKKGVLTVVPSPNLSANIQANTNTHTNLELTYTWLQPVVGLKINYDLFVPNISTARCLATVIQGETTQNLVFTPEQREFTLINAPIHQPPVHQQTVRKYSWELTFRRLVSGCIAATGLFWFAQRAWGMF